MNNFIKKTLKKDKFLVLLFFIILSLFCFRKIIVSPGTVGHLLDWSFPSEVKELQTYFNEAFYNWRSFTLGYNEPFMVVGLWAGFWGFFGHLGFSGEWVSKFCLLSLIPLAGFSMYLLLIELFPSSGKEKKINLPAFFGSLFYAVSPVMINQILGGAVLYLIAYGLSPLGLLLFIKGVNNKKINWSRGIILAFIWTIAGIDNHFLMFWVALFFVYAVFIKEKRIMYLKLLGFVLFLVFILNSYWLVGFLLNYRSNAATFQTTGASEAYLLNLAAHSGPLTSVISLMANFNPELFKSVMLPYLIKPWFFASFVLLITIFLFSLVGLRKRIVLYALFIITAGTFFAKGIYPPFGEINLWLYRNFVPMNLFRTLHHIQFFLIFGYSILVGNLFEYVGLKFKKQLTILFTLSFLVLLTIYIHPLLTGNINNGVFTFQEPKSLTKIKETMDNLDKKPNYGGDYRISFFPMSASVGFKGQRMDLAPGGSFTTVINSPRPALNSITGDYRGEISQYIEKNIYSGDSDGYAAKLLALAEVRYLIPRNDLIYLHLLYGINFWNQQDAYQKLLEFLNSQQELTKINSYSDMSLWENRYFLPHFYTPKNIIYSNGGIPDLLDIFKFENPEIRSEVFLASQIPNINRIKEISGMADVILLKGELENTVEKFGISSYPEILFPFVRQKPGNLFYSLVLTQEKFYKWLVRDQPDALLEKHLFYASKRIAELVNFKIEDIGQVNSLLENYKLEMENAIGETKEIDKLNAYLGAHRLKINQSNLGTEIKNKSGTVFNDLKDKIAELKPKQDFSRLVYKINIPKKGNYEVLVKNNPGVINWTKLEEKNLDEGEQELILPFSGMSENLVDENLRIKDYSPNSIYRISFDYEATQSGSFFVAEGKTGKTAETQLFSTEDKFRNFEMFFLSSPEATNAAVKFVNLKENNSEIKYNNVLVQQILQPMLMLRSNKPQTSDLKPQTPKITFVKINPTKYKVKVEGAKDPYTIVFSESYNDGWKAYIAKDGKTETNDFQDKFWNILGKIGAKITSLFLKNKGYGKGTASYFNGEIKEGTHNLTFLEPATFETWDEKPLPEETHLLVNGYANSWYITPEDAGGKQDYDLIIDFAPQRLFYVGLFISLATLITCLGFILKSRIKNL